MKKRRNWLKIFIILFLAVYAMYSLVKQEVAMNKYQKEKASYMEQINLAKQKKADVLFVYNKVKIKVSPSTTREHVINSFFSQAACLPDMGMQQKKMGM